MVVGHERDVGGLLTPLFQLDEKVKKCTKCKKPGLCSPDAKRTDFTYRKLPSGNRGYRPHCKGCFLRATRLAATRREQRGLPAEERNLRNARRYREKARDLRNMDSIIRRERQGRTKLKTLEQVMRTTGSAHVSYPLWPFRVWIGRLLVAEARLQGHTLTFDQAMSYEDEQIPTGVVQQVARDIGCEPRNIYRLMRENTTIDEMAIDRRCARHGGIMPWEIYATHDVMMLGLRHGGAVLLVASLVAAHDFPTAGQKREEPLCCDRDCCELAAYRVHAEKIKNGRHRRTIVTVVEDAKGRFCFAHAERLALARQELDNDAHVMAGAGGASRAEVKSRKSNKSQPTCCAPNCWNERVPPKRFCQKCEDDGYSEDNYE